MTTKQKALQLIGDLEYTYNSYNLTDEDFLRIKNSGLPAPKRHVVEIEIFFDEPEEDGDLTSIICNSWEDVLERLPDYLTNQPKSKEKKMTHKESQQFVTKWVNEHKYSVSWSGNATGETAYYKTEEEARQDTNFSNFENEFNHWQDAKTKEDYIYEVELRRLDKIAKKDYERIISYLEDDDIEYAMELLNDAHFTDSERLWAKASYISDEWDEENSQYKLAFQEKPFANYATRAFEEKEFVTFESKEVN